MATQILHPRSPLAQDPSITQLPVLLHPPSTQTPFHAFSISLTSHTQARYSNRETPNGNAQDLLPAPVLWNVDGIVHVLGDGTR
jgi:hypothetical protein